MKKIPTMFKREYDDEGYLMGLSDTFTNDHCKYALEHGTITVKIDGSACMIQDGKLFCRYDAKLNKHGKPKPIPEDAIKCQPERDPITGHLPCWRPAENDNMYKWQRVAFDNYIKSGGSIENGTYEAIGPHFTSNPYHLSEDTLVRHGSKIIDVTEDQRTVDGIKKLVRNLNEEGIVIWVNNEPVCKLKRVDMNCEWNGSTKKR